MKTPRFFLKWMLVCSLGVAACPAAANFPQCREFGASGIYGGPRGERPLEPDGDAVLAGWPAVRLRAGWPIASHRRRRVRWRHHFLPCLSTRRVSEVCSVSPSTRRSPPIDFVYIYYTATTPSVHNRISRFTANGNVAVPGSETVIFELEGVGIRPSLRVGARPGLWRADIGGGDRIWGRPPHPFTFAFTPRDQCSRKRGGGGGGGRAGRRRELGGVRCFGFVWRLDPQLDSLRLEPPSRISRPGFRFPWISRSPMTALFYYLARGTGASTGVVFRIEHGNTAPSHHHASVLSDRRARAVSDVQRASVRAAAAAVSMAA